MSSRATITPQEAIKNLARKGISVRAWALDHGFSPSLVQMVVNGQRKSRIGKSHNIAVLLGIKEGEINGGCAECEKRK